MLTKMTFTRSIGNYKEEITFKSVKCSKYETSLEFAEWAFLLGLVRNFKVLTYFLPEIDYLVEASQVFILIILMMKIAKFFEESNNIMYSHQKPSLMF